MKAPIGIDAIAFAVPRAYLDLADLAAARGVPPEKYAQGLGTHRMAVASADEDAVSLAANAARDIFDRAAHDPGRIGLVISGTESAVDHAKPIAAYVHGLLDLPRTARVFETKHACFGGTAGLLHAVDWIASGSARGRSALVLCSDVARYAVGSAGEPTQGAGAVAMIVSERPRLLEIDVGVSGSYAHDVDDFWRPLYRKDALADGRFSVDCYLRALGGAYDEWRRACANAALPTDLARTCYHVPYGKMARKAHRHRKIEDGLAADAADASFEVEVEASLDFPSQVGNVYTASLYVALASLLFHEAPEIVGRRIGLFSYGSGCTAEFFSGRVSAAAPAMVRALRLDDALDARERLSVAQYEAIRAADATLDTRPVAAPPPSASTSSSSPSPSPSRTAVRERPSSGARAVYCGIDEHERRVYAWRNGATAEAPSDAWPAAKLA